MKEPKKKTKVRKFLAYSAECGSGSPLKALDLFCCAGGASTGITRAGFDASLPPRICSTHTTWSIEKNGECPTCEIPTVLVIANAWYADSEQPEYEKATGDETVAGEYVSVDEEVTGHWCPKCQRLVSLSLNT